jgi:hypothetical protein
LLVDLEQIRTQEAEEDAVVSLEMCLSVGLDIFVFGYASRAIVTGCLEMALVALLERETNVIVPLNIDPSVSRQASKNFYSRLCLAALQSQCNSLNRIDCLSGRFNLLG